MKSKASVAMAIYSCLLFLTFGISAPRVTAGQTVVGLYKVTGMTDLGSQVRITMQITLINSGTDKVVISEARLRSLNGVSPYEPTPLLLQPNVNASVTQDFTITKSEYQAWQRSERARPHLGLKVQISGSETKLTVPLFPYPGAR
jgi:hypothetical protein